MNNKITRPTEQIGTDVPQLFSGFLNPNENFLDITRLNGTTIRLPLTGSLYLSFTPTEKSDCYELRITEISITSSPIMIKRKLATLLFTLDPETPAIAQGGFGCKLMRFAAAFRLLLTVNPEEPLLSLLIPVVAQFDFYPASNIVTASLIGIFPSNIPVLSLGRFTHLLFCQDKGKRKDIETVKHSIQIGKTNIGLTVTTEQGENSNCFLIIHDDEDTATEAVLDHIKANGGKMIELNNEGKRKVTFKTKDGKEVTFDPNRIFTDEGLKKDLKDKNHDKKYEEDNDIINEVKKLRDKILKLLEECRCEPIIAIHNNKDDDPDGFGINSYSEGGNEEKKGNTRKLGGNPNIVKGEDPDNFFLVTKKEDFDKIKGKYNVVLQTENNDSTLPGGKGPYDDGSLSVKFKDKQYFNLEVQHKDRDKQKEMLADLEKVKKCETLKR